MSILFLCVFFSVLHHALLSAELEESAFPALHAMDLTGQSDGRVIELARVSAGPTCAAYRVGQQDGVFILRDCKHYKVKYYSGEQLVWSVSTLHYGVFCTHGGGDDFKQNVPFSCQKVRSHLSVRYGKDELERYQLPAERNPFVSHLCDSSQSGCVMTQSSGDAYLMNLSLVKRPSGLDALIHIVLGQKICCDFNLSDLGHPDFDVFAGRLALEQPVKGQSPAFSDAVVKKDGSCPGGCLFKEALKEGCVVDARVLPKGNGENAHTGLPGYILQNTKWVQIWRAPNLFDMQNGIVALVDFQSVERKKMTFTIEVERQGMMAYLLIKCGDLYENIVAWYRVVGGHKARPLDAKVRSIFEKESVCLYIEWIPRTDFDEISLSCMGNIEAKKYCGGELKSAVELHCETVTDLIKGRVQPLIVNCSGCMRNRLLDTHTCVVDIPFAKGFWPMSNMIFSAVEDKIQLIYNFELVPYAPISEVVCSRRESQGDLCDMTIAPIIKVYNNSVQCGAYTLESKIMDWSKCQFVLLKNFEILRSVRVFAKRDCFCPTQLLIKKKETGSRYHWVTLHARMPGEDVPPLSQLVFDPVKRVLRLQAGHNATQSVDILGISSAFEGAVCPVETWVERVPNNWRWVFRYAGMKRELAFKFDKMPTHFSIHWLADSISLSVRCGRVALRNLYIVPTADGIERGFAFCSQEKCVLFSLLHRLGTDFHLV